MSDAYLSNPNLKKIGVNLEFTQDQIQEYIKCAQDPIYFVKNYVKIVHVDKGLIPLDLYAYQERMINTFIIIVLLSQRCRDSLVNQLRSLDLFFIMFFSMKIKT